MSNNDNSNSTLKRLLGKKFKPDPRLMAAGLAGATTLSVGLTATQGKLHEFTARGRIAEINHMETVLAEAGVNNPIVLQDLEQQNIAATSEAIRERTHAGWLGVAASAMGVATVGLVGSSLQRKRKPGEEPEAGEGEQSRG